MGRSKVLFGFGLGLAAAGLARELLPAFRGLGRPLAKATVKSTLQLFDKSRVRAAQWREALEDLTAEARAELDTEQAVPFTAEGGQDAAERVYHA